MIALQLVEREEFGVKRHVCGCKVCRLWCKVSPGNLIPSDLGRLIPPEVDPFAWARQNLLANDRGGLQTATKPDRSCKFLTENEKCSIWAVSPFGCAFFRCTPAQTDEESDRLKILASKVVQADHDANGLYAQIWHMLRKEGYRRSASDGHAAAVSVKHFVRQLKHRQYKKKAQAKRKK
jgi:predicted nucleic acid-binding protein